MKKKEELVLLSRKSGIFLDDFQAEQLLKFYEMLIDRNQHVNLTAITEWEDVVRKHFLDSMSLCLYIEDTNSSVIDIGTGAGFPGIPLKIACPELEITLVDTLNKRVVFLEDVIDELGLKNISVIQSRAEDLGRSEDYRMKFDFCVSRAVANLPVLLEYCTPFVKIGGHFVSYKGGIIDEELTSSQNALVKLGCSFDKVETPNLPECDFERSLLFIKRTEMLDDKYPRRAGIPLKRPL